jgi:hypothetical protein
VLQDSASAIRKCVHFVQDDKVESSKEPDGLMGRSYYDVCIPVAQFRIAAKLKNAGTGYGSRDAQHDFSHYITSRDCKQHLATVSKDMCYPLKNYFSLSCAAYGKDQAFIV